MPVGKPYKFKKKGSVMPDKKKKPAKKSAAKSKRKY